MYPERKTREITQKEKIKIIALAKSGKCSCRIARIVKCSVSQVCGVIAQNTKKPLFYTP